MRDDIYLVNVERITQISNPTAGKAFQQRL